MGQVDNQDFTVKEDGTIVRGPKLKELKKKSKSKRRTKKTNQTRKQAMTRMVA